MTAQKTKKNLLIKDWVIEMKKQSWYQEFCNDQYKLLKCEVS